MKVALTILSTLTLLGCSQEDVQGLPVAPPPTVPGGGRRSLFERLLGEHLVDVGRGLDPENENLFTWWAPWRNLRARNIGWRLDYVLASKVIAARAESCVVLAELGTSDHAPVVMRWSTTPRST
jgi:hypothetical protein